MLSESGLALGGCEIETRIAKPGDPHYEFARVTTLQSLSPLRAAGVLDDVDAEQLEGLFRSTGDRHHDPPRSSPPRVSEGAPDGACSDAS